jgi:nucleoside-diphosphate-sugar epimerase
VGTVNSWTGGKVLVTGATGFLGRHISRLLVTENVEVCLCAHQDHKWRDFPLRQLDICDRNSVFDLVKLIKPDSVVHLAAAGVTRSDLPLSKLLQINVVGTDNLLSATAKFASHAPVVLVGTGYEYRSQSRPLREEDELLPASAYATSKSAAGLCASFYAHQVPITLVRLFNTYGPGEPRQRLLPYIVSCAQDGVPIALTGCEQIRDFTFVSDAAAALWCVLKSPPTTAELRVLNVGSGQPVAVKQFVNKAICILEECGYLPKVMFGARPYRCDDPMYCVADTTRISQSYGFRTLIDLDEGIRLTIASLLEEAAVSQMGCP